MSSYEEPAVLLPTRAASDLERRVPRLRRRLVEQATDENLLDVAYRTLETPLGSLLLAATPIGLVKVAFPREGEEEVLRKLAAQISPRVLYAPARLERPVRELDEYFAGTRRAFELTLDFRLAHGFRRQVLERLAEVRYGTTLSYAALAAAAGSPKAVRAVGSACATNPLPVVVPCHRVLRSDGTLGGYGGGIEAKQRLILLESANA